MAVEVALAPDNTHHRPPPLQTFLLPELPPHAFSLLMAALKFPVAGGHMGVEDCDVKSWISLFLSQVCIHTQEYLFSRGAQLCGQYPLPVVSQFTWATRRR